MGMWGALDGRFGDADDAVVVGESRASWATLLNAATAVATRVAGAPAVAIRAEPSLDTIVGIVGGLLAGVPVVPLPPDSGADETAYMLADSGATMLLVEQGGVIDLQGPHVRHDPSTALVLYTSGTTGRPKGVQLSAAAIAADLDALAGAWAWTPDDTLVHGLPLYHVHGLVLGVLGPLRLGSKLRHTVRPTPEAYAAAGGTLYFGVPTVWSRVCASPSSARALASARLLVSGSAALPAPVFQALTELTGARPVERYGMTETLITCSTRFDGGRVAGSVGSPVAGVRTRLGALESSFDGGPSDRDAGSNVGAAAGRGGSSDLGAAAGRGGSPDPGAAAGRGGSSDPGAATGRRAAAADGFSDLGELEVSGRTLFSGYLGLNAMTASAYTDDGWFRTGDIATIGPDGMHRIVGRASIDLIKTGGYRVGAGEVEDALLAHPGVAEVAVVGVPHEDLGQEIVAFVVGEGVQAEALIAFAAARLSWHKRPRRVVLVAALPRNGMGKVQKKALLE